MITYNISYRFQLKEPVQLILKGTTTHTQTKPKQIFLKFIIDVLCYRIMLTYPITSTNYCMMPVFST